MTSAKSKITGMLHKSFNAAKCKTSLKMVVSRTKLLKNKREVQVRQMRRDLAQLLETGQDQTARIRVEHVIREEKTVSAYDLIEVYCELIAARLPIIESQKHCPIDLKEAIASVIFAGPRCADLPELMEIRKHFTAKYGKEFITAAIEVRPDCGVSGLIVEKLSAKAPDVKLKMKMLAEVAKEHNIKWEPKALEEKRDDILNGPASFASASNVMEPSSFSPSPSHYPNMDSNIKMPEDNVPPNKSPAVFSNINVTSPSYAVSPGSSDKSPGDKEVKHAYSREENDFSYRSNWNLEFQDAASAAQAAAESAERASMAAKAAAKLASLESMTKHSTESYEPPRYVSSSKLETGSVVDSTNMQVDSRKDMHDMRPRVENVQRDYIIQASANSVAKSLSRKNSDTGSVASARSPSSRSVKSVAPYVIHQEPDANSFINRQESFSSSQFASKSYRDETDEEDEVMHKPDERHPKPADSSFPGNYDDYSWDDHDDGRKVVSPDVVFDSYESDREVKDIFDAFDTESMQDISLEQKQNPSLPSDAFQNPRQQKSEYLLMESSSEIPGKRNHQVDYEEEIPKTDYRSPSDDNLQPTYDSDDHESVNEDEIEDLKKAETTKRNYAESSSRKGSISAASGTGSTSDDDGKVIEEDILSSDRMSSPSAVYSNDNAVNFEVDSDSLEKGWRRPGISVRNDQQASKYSGSSGDLDSYEESEFGESLNFGPLRGGLKNKNYAPPSYVTNPITDYSSEKEIHSNSSESITSSRVRSEEKSSKDSVSKVYASERRVSEDSYADEVEDQILFRRSENPLSTFEGQSSGKRNIPNISEKLVSPRYGMTSGDAKSPEHESIIHQREANGESSISSSSLMKLAPDSYEEQSYNLGHRYPRDATSAPKRIGLDASPSTEETTFRKSKLSTSSEGPGHKLYDQMQRTKAYLDSSSPVSKISSLSGSDEEELSTLSSPLNSAAKRGNNKVPLSRRTRGVQSNARDNTSPRSISQSTGGTSQSKEKNKYTPEATKPPPGERRERRGSDDISSSGHHEAQPRSSDIESSTVGSGPKPQQNETRQPATSENDRSSNTSSFSGKAAPSKSSQENPSHVHHKLPDYDTLQAYFASLRSNVRPE